MPPTHLASDTTLMRYAAGALGEGPSLVVDVHMSLCSESRRRADMFEAVGGTLVETLAPSTMKPHAYAEVLQKIHESAPIEPAQPQPTRGELVPGLPVPRALQGYEIGPWRFLAPGLKVSRIEMEPHEKAKVLLLRAAPGTYLPDHGHGGEEYICVLAGSIADQTGHYGPGDLAEADDTLHHQPRVDSETDCVCLVAVEGGLRLRSWIGRLLQPLLGF